MEIEKPQHKKGGARPGAGRKPFQPTDEDRRKVEAMAGYGVPIEQIASLIRGGIDKETLYKYFSHEIETGRAKANAQVGKTLFQKAMSGDTAAAIWWTKSRMGWKSAERHEITGADGGPVQTVDVSRLSTETLAEILAAKDGAEIGGTD